MQSQFEALFSSIVVQPFASLTSLVFQVVLYVFLEPHEVWSLQLPLFFEVAVVTALVATFISCFRHERQLRLHAFRSNSDVFFSNVAKGFVAAVRSLFRKRSIATDSETIFGAERGAVDVDVNFVYDTHLRTTALVSFLCACGFAYFIDCIELLETHVPVTYAWHLVVRVGLKAALLYNILELTDQMMALRGRSSPANETDRFGQRNAFPFEIRPICDGLLFAMIQTCLDVSARLCGMWTYELRPFTSFFGVPFLHIVHMQLSGTMWSFAVRHARILVNTSTASRQCLSIFRHGRRVRLVSLTKLDSHQSLHEHAEHAEAEPYFSESLSSLLSVDSETSKDNRTGKVEKLLAHRCLRICAKDATISRTTRVHRQTSMLSPFLYAAKFISSLKQSHRDDARRGDELIGQATVPPRTKRSVAIGKDSSKRCEGRPRVRRHHFLTFDARGIILTSSWFSLRHPSGKYLCVKKNQFYASKSHSNAARWLYSFHGVTHGMSVFSFRLADSAIGEYMLCASPQGELCNPSEASAQNSLFGLLSADDGERVQFEKAVPNHWLWIDSLRFCLQYTGLAAVVAA
ncbi:MAG: hypothetical protein MHM6MM_003161, partial [Cercozoa sp. M6MM]